METIPVTLIVKASNQQFEDQTIKCELSWTIRKLKGYLTEVYPCKPSTEEQKLIYSGQLLHDAVVLKDVLRQYEGQETHTVHLVFTPKHNQFAPNMKMAAKTNNTSTNSTNPSPIGDRVDGAIVNTVGLRQRHAQSASSTSGPTPNPLNMQHNIPANIFYNTPGSNSSTVANSAELMMAQQLAMQSWMQQQYMQYLNQYMNVISNGQVSTEATSQPGQTTTGSITNPNLVQSLPNAAYYPFYSQIPTATNTPTPSPAPIPSSSSSSSQSLVQNPDPNQAAAGATPAENADVAPANEVQPQQAQRRFPNIVEQEQENRDWLDIFFSLCRHAVLLAVIYLYSSPTRCLTVMIIGILLYLYQIGFFRNNNVDRIEQARRIIFQQMNNNNQIEAPVAAAAAAPQAQVEANQANGEQENQENVANENSEIVPAPVVTEANRTNINDIAAFLRTLVLSFFTSIIPDTLAS